MDDNALFRIAMGARAFPNNFVSKILWPKDSVKNDFEIMASYWDTHNDSISLHWVVKRLDTLDWCIFQGRVIP